MTARRGVRTIGALLLIAAGGILTTAAGPPAAFAIQAPAVTPPPVACEGFVEIPFYGTDVNRRFQVAENGRYGSSVGGVGTAGRMCWRKYNYISRVGVNQGPQQLKVGQSVSLSTSYFGVSAFSVVNDPILGPVLTEPLHGDPAYLPSSSQPTAWTWDINNFLDNEPAMRDINGKLGSKTWNYQQLFLIPPTFDMSGCGTGLSVGRRVATCTVRLVKGPYYPTGRTAPIPWTLFMGHYSSLGSTVLPQLINDNGTALPRLTRYDEYVDAPVWIEPSPYARQNFVSHPDDLLTVDFDASASLYNGFIENYQWEFKSSDGQWNRIENGEKLTQTFPGTGNYSVKLTISADGQTDSLTGSIDIGYNAGGLSVKVQSPSDSLRADPVGDRTSDHEEVTVTVSNLSDQPAQNVTLDPNVLQVPGAPGAPPNLAFVGATPDLNFGTVAPNESVTRTFTVRGTQGGKGRFVAQINGGARDEKNFTIAASCRVGSTTSGGRGFSVLFTVNPSSGCAYTPPIDYLTPFANGGSGSPKFRFDRSPSAEITRQGPNGIEVLTNGVWKSRSNPLNNESLAIAPQSWTAASIAGADRSEYPDPVSFGGNPGNAALFQPGDHVIINPGGATQERRTVTALGSLVYDRALTYPHVLGEMITFDPTPDVGVPLVAPLPAVVFALAGLGGWSVWHRRRRRRRVELEGFPR